MLNFKVNEFITLKLENNETIIYVNGKRFNQCKFLMLNISYDKITAFNDIESIDEVASKLDKSLENKQFKIPPEVEFWGHCSNLQVWAESNYNTRLLHSNLAFPLLKKLTEVGDPIAKRVFGEEIAKRYESGYLPVVRYLLLRGYLLYLPEEYLLDISKKKDLKFIKLLFELIEQPNDFSEETYYNKELAIEYFLRIVSVIDEKTFLKLIDRIKEEKQLLQKIITEIFKKNIPKIIDVIYKLANQKDYTQKFINEGVALSEAGFLALLDLMTGKYTSKIDSFDEINRNYIQHYKIDDNGHITGILIAYPEGPFIRVIPKQIKNLKYLEELTLRGQEIKLIPEEIVKIKSLRILELIDNPITKFSDFIKNLGSRGKLKIEKELQEGYYTIKWISNRV